MKTFKDYVNESKNQPFDTIPHQKFKKVWIRISKETTPDAESMQRKFGGDIYGFLATKHNLAAGYIVSSLNKSEKEEFGKDAFRVSSEKTFTTTIAKIDLKVGKVIFLDNEAYEEGEIKWQSPMVFDRLIIDNNEKALKAFNVDMKYLKLVYIRTKVDAIGYIEDDPYYDFVIMFDGSKTYQKAVNLISKVASDFDIYLIDYDPKEHEIKIKWSNK